MHRFRMPITAIAFALSLPAFGADIPVKLYRNPNCGCCNVYAEHLKSNGFKVDLIDTHDAAALHRKYAVPERLEGCHTAVIGGYVFEGLIPAQYIKRVLDEHPPIKGLSVPGMPVGAPGMPGAKDRLIEVYYLGASASPKVFATF